MTEQHPAHRYRLLGFPLTLAFRSSVGYTCQHPELVLALLAAVKRPRKDLINPRTRWLTAAGPLEEVTPPQGPIRPDRRRLLSGMRGTVARVRDRSAITKNKL